MTKNADAGNSSVADFTVSNHDNSTSLRSGDETTLDMLIGDYIIKFGVPFLLVMGGTGNTLSVLVMSRKSMRQLSLSIYLIVLSFTSKLISRRRVKVLF